jgi:hypothetical protein
MCVCVCACVGATSAATLTHDAYTQAGVHWPLCLLRGSKTTFLKAKPSRSTELPLSNLNPLAYKSAIRLENLFRTYINPRILTGAGRGLSI